MDFKALALIVFTVIYLYQMTLAVIHMRSARNPVPVNVADVYDPETYRKWRAYHAEKSRLGIISSTASFIVEMVLLAFNSICRICRAFPAGGSVPAAVRCNPAFFPCFPGDDSLLLAQHHGH